MTPHDPQRELDLLTRALADQGWDRLEEGLTGAGVALPQAGAGYRMLISPARRTLLTATFGPHHTGADLQGLDPRDPEALVWHARAENLPFQVLLAAARAAAGPEPGPGPLRLLREAGWVPPDPVRSADDPGAGWDLCHDVELVLHAGLHTPRHLVTAAVRALLTLADPA